MIMRRIVMTALTAVAIALPALPATAAAQACEGKKPKGGKWVASGELYLDRARKNSRPQDKLRNYRSALNILSEGFVKQPENPRNYLMAGQAYIGLDDYAGADSVWTRAEEMWTCYHAKLDTLRYNAWVIAFNRGVRYSNSGDAEKANAEYLKAYTVYDKLPQPLIQIGTYYAQQAQVVEGEEAQTEARAKAIDFFRKALAAMADAERLKPAERERFSRAATFNVAQMLAFERRYEEAARAYDAYLADEPDNALAKSNAAVVLTRAADQAKDQADEMEDGPEKDALLARADSLRNVASDYYSELLARDDLDADDYHNVGVGLSQIGKAEQAIDAFNKALDLEPYRHNSLQQLAFACFALQRNDTLLNVAQVLVERYPLSLNNLALLANAYRELDMSEKALEILQRREALKLELLGLQLNGEEGTYRVSGLLHNIGLPAETPVTLQFDFYDDAGEVAATNTVTVNAPEQDTQVRFTVEAESSAPVSGFTYRLLGEEEQAGT